ncbi:ABC transporter ATP-binding protein [Renibacterium salmoninarum ATCC 33209]|uniref:ABC transporter ATP-binding protein n=1 Tax=Renibacterium salmoninarum (strain ATCC 33209 / DSM 20767 / JCM 11484 / NBRC 15589 / NCIMB 2235) TaxID=288705 RepID=A9WKX5_RENSM|nr:ABC transporter ATP-binding protein [Renibacterium salmoninarum ATCC 33209]
MAQTVLLSPRGRRNEKSSSHRCTRSARSADKASARVKQLSGGQRRRLDLALATANQPEVLFLDEPTTGLDPESRQRTWDVVSALHRNGTTVFLTTHYLEEVTQYAERLAIMHDGEIALTGSVAAVLAVEPASISFSVGSDASLLGLPNQAVITPESSGQRVEIRTSGLQSELLSVLSWASANGIVLQRLKASEASLDEVFRRISSGNGPNKSTHNSI